MLLTWKQVGGIVREIGRYCTVCECLRYDKGVFTVFWECRKRITNSAWGWELVMDRWLDYGSLYREVTFEL